MEIFIVQSDWLALYHLIPNAKLPPITAQLIMPTYTKSTRVLSPNSQGTPNQWIIWQSQQQLWVTYKEGKVDTRQL